MQPQPLPRIHYEAAKQLQIVTISLHFYGGNDEGILTVDFNSQLENLPSVKKSLWDSFEDEVQRWAEEAYKYNGAGDGTNYGDDIVYDIANNKVSFNSWCMVREDEETQEWPLKCEAEEVQNHESD